MSGGWQTLVFEKVMVSHADFAEEAGGEEPASSRDGTAGGVCLQAG